MALNYLLNIEHLIGWQIIPIVVLFLTAFYTDAKEFKIYNWNTAGLAIFNIAYFVIYPAYQGNYKFAGINLLGGIASFLLIMGVAMYFMIQMGGDIKFVGAAGIAFGGIRAILWVLLSVFIAGIHGSYKVKIKKEDKQGKIPFAPYFSAGFAIYLIIYFLTK